MNRISLSRLALSFRFPRLNESPSIPFSRLVAFPRFSFLPSLPMRLFRARGDRGGHNRQNPKSLPFPIVNEFLSHRLTSPPLPAPRCIQQRQD